jgi:hypothetical protein
MSSLRPINNIEAIKMDEQNIDPILPQEKLKKASKRLISLSVILRASELLHIHLPSVVS